MKEDEKCNVNIDVDDKDFEDGVDLCTIVKEWAHGRKDRVLIWGAFNQGDETKDMLMENPKFDETYNVERSPINVNNVGCIRVGETSVVQDLKV